MPFLPSGQVCGPAARRGRPAAAGLRSDAGYRAQPGTGGPARRGSASAVRRSPRGHLPAPLRRIRPHMRRSPRRHLAASAGSTAAARSGARPWCPACGRAASRTRWRRAHVPRRDTVEAGRATAHTGQPARPAERPGSRPTQRAGRHKIASLGIGGRVRGDPRKPHPPALSDRSGSLRVRAIRPVSRYGSQSEPHPCDGHRTVAFERTEGAVRHGRLRTGEAGRSADGRSTNA